LADKGNTGKRDANGRTQYTEAVSEKLAIVLAGGGARCAYQAGVLRAWAKRFPDLKVPIYTGVSAGAINSAFLANHEGSFKQAVDDLCSLWGELRTEKVLDPRFLRLTGRALGWGARLALGALSRRSHTRGLVDTSPLRHLLLERLCGGDEECGLPGVERKLAKGTLESLALTSTNYATGRAITWVQGRQLDTRHGIHQSRNCRLSVDHVMASASIPLFFPAVRLDDGWHGDGGVRQTAPFSPALHLGARRILAISPRRSRADLSGLAAESEHYPPPAQIIGILMNAVFLDNLDHDVETMQRINSLLHDLPTEERQGLVPVELVVIRPSADIGRIAGEYEHRLPWTFRYLTRGWGTRESRASDSIAMLLFEADYTRRLMDLGEEDGEARLPEVERLVLETMAHPSSSGSSSGSSFTMG
jgi:NTE family protein